MRKQLAVAMLLLACPGVQSTWARPETRQPGPVSFDDLMSMKTVSAPMLAPTGDSVLFTVRGWEAGRDGRKEARTHIWRVSTRDGSVARQITFGDKGESQPGWAPDGASISFLAARGPGSGDEEPAPQIWIMPADGGEAWKLTDAKEGVSAYAWSPASTRIAFTAKEPLTDDAEARRKRRDDPRVFEGDYRRTHLWTIDIASRRAASITEGDAFTVRGEPSWAPDGARLAFTAAPTPILRDGRDDVYVLTVATRALQKVTSDLGLDTSPIWSPDGSTIAFLSTPNAGAPKGDGIPLSAVGNAHLMLYDAGTQRLKDASAGFDLSPTDMQWTPDGARLIFTAGSRVHREVFTYDLASGRYGQVTKEKNVTLGSMTKDGALVAFTMNSSTVPTDVYVSDSRWVSPRRLTTINSQAATFALGAAEVITWTSDGVEIEGVLLKPVRYQPGTRYPLLVVAHGGPTGAHVNGFRVGYGDGGQLWAGQGWAVLYPNPRGSTNYGETFMRANFNDWGGGDYRDIMTGVDAVIGRGIADPDRLAFQGWSYGGYLTCWVVSQTTRFKAAMMGAGLTDLYSMYGTTDVPGYLGTFFGGSPSKDTLPLYLARSGMTDVDKVTTPLLILHGGNDERVPTSQAMEFHRALKDRGKITEFVIYPREGHGFSEYYHQLDRLKRQYDWITRYTLGDASGKPTAP